MQKWEYKVIYRSWEDGITSKPEYVWSDTKKLAHEKDAVEKRLKELGQEGWELISVDTVITDGKEQTNFYLRHLSE